VGVANCYHVEGTARVINGALCGRALYDWYIETRRAIVETVATAKSIRGRQLRILFSQTAFQQGYKKLKTKRCDRSGGIGDALLKDRHG
jgi:hypothetical protein